MHLYLRDDHPVRTLILTTTAEEGRQGVPDRALVLRAGRAPTQVIVEFLVKSQVDLSNVIRLSSRSILGCLGLINVSNDIFLAVVTAASSIGNIRPSHLDPENASRIHEVAFFSLTSSNYDDPSLVTDDALADSTLETPDSIMRDAYQQNIQPIYEHPCAPLTKILSSGTFYYATEPPWDLSTRLSERLKKDKATRKDVSGYDERFIWNEAIARSFLDFRERLDGNEKEEFDRCQFIILAIQGYVGLFTLPLGSAMNQETPIIGTLTLLSRLGKDRTGTRYNVRGVDDDGNCANFVETELIFSTDKICVSYVQVRGSVPLFWEQQGLQTFGQKIQITRPQVASQPAFDRHFAQLVEEYSAVHAVNLLGTKENEAILTEAFARHVQALQSTGGYDVGLTHFDFHTAVKAGGHDSVSDFIIIPAVRSAMDRFSFTIVDVDLDEIITMQHGVFRVNCLDCLDRTNFVQELLSRSTLEKYLVHTQPSWIQSNTLWTYHRELWAENGDALSRIYAGTGALNTSFTRTGKRTLGGFLSDATKTVSRAYINNFQDKSKQIAIDMFLGNLSNQRPVTIFDPIHDSVRAALAQRLSEYSTTKQATIFTGTWNLNGRGPAESLLPWLFPRPNAPDPDIFALGFQEIVPLTAQQIVQTDPEKKRIWERFIVETLDGRPNKKSTYVIVRSEQLVGTALFLLVKSGLTGVIRNVEAAVRKTGLRGMSGNKGAVAIRLEYHDTSFCFLTAHMAAGHVNVEERNNDYRTIVSGLHFSKGKTIGSHQNVIWLADTNYRIDLENEVVRDLATRDELDLLVACDQLKQALDSQATFVGYEEGPLLFRPTYRYDINSDEYDTSEKMRIPAWTDRILYRGIHLDLSVYSRAELKGSDHRPVFAIFRAEIRVVDPVKKSALSQMLLKTVTETAAGEKLDQKLAKMTITQHLTYDLPNPSTEDEAWWEGPDHPGGVVRALPDTMSFAFPNPFDTSPLQRQSVSRSPSTSSTSTPLVPTRSATSHHSPSLISSSSSSDEELYRTAASLPPPMEPQKRKPPPPPPRGASKGIPSPHRE